MMSLSIARHRTAAAVIAAALVCLPGPAAHPAAADGVIRGRVELRRTQVTVEARPDASSMNMPGHRSAESRPAVIYLESAPLGAFEINESARATMNQQGQMFVPHVLAVTVGTTVDFPNADLTFHNVFSLSKPRPFDLGRYARGASKSVRFDRPGVVQVFCDIHSHMSAYILVFAHRFFAVTDASGRYTITGVPPGSYRLTAWYEGDVKETRTVVVPDGGGAADADFVIR